jgi:hypothetical protein
MIEVNVKNAPSGGGYLNVRASNEGAGIHQKKLSAAALAGSRDAQGHLPPGLPIAADGTPATDGVKAVVCIVGPDSVRLGDKDVFGNAIFSGLLNRKAIETNLGRALSAEEIAKFPPALVLV